MSARLDELERLEKATTPGPWEWAAVYELPNCYGDLERRWAVCRVGNRERVVSAGLISEADESIPEDAEMKVLVALRNAAPALLAIARAAHDVAECLCLPGEPEAYATLGERLRSALAALDQVEEAGGSKCSR